MIWLNAILAGGLLAALAPLAVHLWHRRQVKPRRWGAMRFLLQMSATSRRQAWIDQWLLLAIRTLAIALLVLAVMRPAVAPQQTATGLDAEQRAPIVRQGSTAALLLIDDSASSASGRERSRLAQLQSLAHTYVDSLQPGDEVSVLRLSELGTEPAAPTVQHSLVRVHIDALEPRAVASNWPALIAAARRQLDRHVNPQVELVLFSDGAATGWVDVDTDSWRQIADSWVTDPKAALGTRARPRVIVVEAGAEAAPGRASGNASVEQISLDRRLISVGQTVDVAVSIRLDPQGGADHQGAAADAVTFDRPGLALRLLVNGIEVDRRPIDSSAALRQTIAFQHTFYQAGSQVIEAVLVGARDQHAADDRRRLAVSVRDGVPVLLVDGVAADGWQGALAFVELALTADAGGGPSLVQPGPAVTTAGQFAVTRVGADVLAGVDFEDYRAVVLGDVARLPVDTLGRLEAYVAAGGGVLVSLGPNSDPAYLNQAWLRDGTGLLPCPVLAAQRATSGPNGFPAPVVDQPQHPALRAFRADDGSSWQATGLRQWIDLGTAAAPAGALTTLLTTPNGDPLLVLRARGLGLVALCATTLDPRWSDLVGQPAFAPLVRGLVAHLGGHITPPRNLAAGERLVHTTQLSASTAALASATTAASASGESPLAPAPVLLGPVRSLAQSNDQRAASAAQQPSETALTLGYWQNRTMWLGPRLVDAGIYTVRAAGPRGQAQPTVTHYTVDAPPSESALRPLSADQREAVAQQLSARWFQDGQQFAQALQLVEQRRVELWPWLVLATVLLLFAETWLTRQQSRGERAVQPAGTRNHG